MTAIAVLCCLAPASGAALAQSAAASAAAAANPEYQALFKRMFNNPQDMDATFKFAEVATRLGDYEAAIGALERVLFYNPNLARVKVELAQLYMRIGGREVAQSYVDQAIATPGASPELIAAAQQALTTGSAAGGAPNGFNLYVYSGMRYQTNASAGPSALLNLPSEFRAAADWNYFTLANAGYTQDFGNGISAEANLFGYYAKQVKLSQFDLGIVELQAGPRIALPGLASDASIKVYGIGTASWLAEDPYYSGAGAGVSTRLTLGSAGRWEPSYEYRDRNFKNSTLYTTSSEQSGVLQIAAINGDGTWFGQAWVSRFSASWNRTDTSVFDFNSYDRVTGDVGLPMPFSLNWWERRWEFVFTPTAGFSVTNYKDPNPAINSSMAREDREWHVGAALDTQVYQNWGVRTFVQYADIHSNLPNFSMTNFSVSFGPTLRF